MGSIIFSGTIIFLTLYYLTKSFNPYILLIGLIISISCQVGDLFFSFLKRKSNLKDTGNFLPGHGGILDRIDGILIGIPIGFTYYNNDFFKMKKIISILGSTGSIGINSLEIFQKKKNLFKYNIFVSK